MLTAMSLWVPSAGLFGSGHPCGQQGPWTKGGLCAVRNLGRGWSEACRLVLMVPSRPSPRTGAPRTTQAVAALTLWLCDFALGPITSRPQHCGTGLCPLPCLFVPLLGPASTFGSVLPLPWMGSHRDQHWPGQRERLLSGHPARRGHPPVLGLQHTVEEDTPVANKVANSQLLSATKDPVLRSGNIHGSPSLFSK